VGAHSGAPVLLMETETANARRLAALDDNAVVATVMSELRKMFPAAPWPTAFVVARLGNDSFQRGGFSFMPTHGSEDLHTRLAAPLYGRRLYLAGEHTSSIHPGTVHGAIVTGRLAAAHVHGTMCGDMLEGDRYEESYLDRLNELENEGGDSAEEWDRNP
jgi:monoamine oxidase